jgi:hypothetical protein
MSMTFSYSGTTVTLHSSLYRNTNIRSVRAQNKLTAEDGTAYIYDHEIEEWYYEISMRCHYAEAVALRAFFIATVKGAKIPFTFTPDSNLDLGAGKGKPVMAQFWQDDFPEIYDAPDRFPVKLLLRAATVTSGYPEDETPS